MKTNDCAVHESYDIFIYQVRVLLLPCCGQNLSNCVVCMQVRWYLLYHYCAWSSSFSVDSSSSYWQLCTCSALITPLKSHSFIHYVVRVYVGCTTYLVPGTRFYVPFLVNGLTRSLWHLILVGS